MAERLFFPVDYRHMCRFFSGGLYNHPVRPPVLPSFLPSRCAPRRRRPRGRGGCAPPPWLPWRAACVPRRRCVAAAQAAVGMHGWLGHAWTKGLQAMQPYDYYWRLDTDSFLIGAVPCVHGARCRHPPARGSPVGLRDLGRRYARAWVRVGAGAICSACSQGTCTLGVLMGTQEHSRWVQVRPVCIHAAHRQGVRVRSAAPAATHCADCL